MNPMDWVRSHWQRLHRIKDTPHAVALGVGVGVFFGFVPLVGFKTLLALGVSRLLGGSMLAAVIAVTLHDILLPLMPLVLRWEYDIGYWLLSSPHTLPPNLHLQRESFTAWLHWSTFLRVGGPLLLGSVIFGLPFAVAAYYLTLAWQMRRASRHNDSLK